MRPMPSGAPAEPGRLTIDTDYLRERLEDLLAIPSPTGYTDTVARHVCGVLDSLGLPYDLTRRGAIRARLPGVSPMAPAPSSRISKRSARR